MAESLYDRGILKPVDLSTLKRVFDEACTQRGTLPETSEAKDIALVILALYNAGMRDESMLKDAVCFRRGGSEAA